MSSRMLKKSPFSPAQPLRAETRFSQVGVLASLRGSTYRSVLLASSLAAALLNGIFEHPARSYVVVSDMRTIGFLGSQHRYAAPC